MNKHVLTSLVIGLIISLSSCSKNEDPKPNPEPATYAINNSTVSINYDKEHQFVVKLGTGAVNATTFTWTSSDPTIGTISTSGLFKGKKIGTTIIKAEGNGTTLTSQVTISPYSTLFKEPVIDFGASIASIKGKETRKFGEQFEQTLYYEGENTKVRFVAYNFEANKLISAGAFFQNTTAVVEELAKFYSERYTFLGEEENIFLFSAGKYLIGIGQSKELGTFAIYVPNTDSNTLMARASSTQFIQKLKEIKFNKIYK